MHNSAPALKLKSPQEHQNPAISGIALMVCALAVLGIGLHAFSGIGAAHLL